ncbi:unnamed protein product [Owenia fusiformis]|uniref:Translin-associated factor X-interacting protein 1 N-terminal domain-containing protein n=1 Tax=Owenia fusiformis TaxID=6347 RepID=A0A8J1XXZ0_OWEFU|nr:unnamed protein product [Owenia fusiformis]
MSRNSTPDLSRHPVIPPIVTNPQDRIFLKALYEFIDAELANVDSASPEQRYIVFKSAFDKIIDHVHAYKPLLTAIKAEYEDTIETIQRGQKEAFFLSGKLKAMSQESSTIRNYRKRSEELERKCHIIKSENEKLEKRRNFLREKRSDILKEHEEIIAPPKKEIKKDKRSIPGLTAEQSTDLRYLTKDLERRERQLRDLTISQKTRYTLKENKDKLKQLLEEKVARRDELSEKIDYLKGKRVRLKVAVDAAHAYNRIAPPHQTMGHVVLKALDRSIKSSLPDNDRLTVGGQEETGAFTQHRETPSTSFEDDDPTKEKEAEMILEYIEKFNELFEERLYEEAATHAANSPKGILRTPETLWKFKDAKVEIGHRSPLLAFCEAIMSNVLALGIKPSAPMSLECVRTVLDQNRVDLLSHWISQDRLTLTEELGDVIFEFCKCRSLCTCSCQALAQRVYSTVAAHSKVVLCLIKQGRVKSALEYAKVKADFAHGDFMDLLRLSPSGELAHALIDSEELGMGTLPIGMVVKTLLGTEAEIDGLQIIHDIYLQSPRDTPEQSALRKLIFDDTSISPDEWMEIANACIDNGFREVGLDMVAATTVFGAMQRALSQ